MKEEVNCAVEFLVRVLEGYCESSCNFGKFQESLVAILTQKYKCHWYVDNVFKGQAYRCLRWNDFETDPVVDEAIKESGLNIPKLPSELTLWIDPSEVSCRFGEQRGFVQIVGKHVSGEFKSYINEIDLKELERISTRSPFSVSSDGDGDSLSTHAVSSSPSSKSSISPVSSSYSYSSTPVLQVEDNGTMLKNAVSNYYSPPTAKKSLFTARNCENRIIATKNTLICNDFPISSKFNSSQGFYNPYCMTSNYQLYKSVDKKFNKSLFNSNYPHKMIDIFG